MGKMHTVLYFAYGSNLHPLRMAERLADPRLLGAASLPGWTRVFDKRGRDGSGKCSIVQADDMLHGALYTLTPADKARLDVIEGRGTGYDTLEVEMPGVGTASTYVARADARASGLAIFDWYLGLVVAGAHHLRFPAACIARLRALPSVPDPDHERAAAHARLLAACATMPPLARVPPSAPTQ